jgi:hypothetical protein
MATIPEMEQEAAHLESEARAIAEGIVAAGRDAGPGEVERAAGERAGRIVAMTERGAGAVTEHRRDVWRNARDGLIRLLAALRVEDGIAPKAPAARRRAGRTARR